MNILVSTSNLAPYRVDWCDELVKLGNNVTIIYTKDKDSERNYNWLVKESKGSYLVKLKSFIIKNEAISFSVFKYLNDKSYNVIIFDGYGNITNFLGIIYLKIKKVRYFINIDGTRKNNRETIINKYIKRYLFSNNAIYLCSSKETKKYLNSFGIDNSKIYIHPFTSLYKKSILKSVPSKKQKKFLKEKLNIEGEKVVLTVGRFIKLKQFDLLIEMWSKMDLKYILVIIGEGKEESKYWNLIKQYSMENIRIIPFQDFDSLVDYYMLSDLFVLPSSNDVWGLVINEAMANGLPILASNKCGASDSLVLNGENGYIFTYNDFDTLFEKINSILENEELQIKMAKKSLDLIKDYNLEDMSRLHNTIFKNENIEN